MSEWSVVQDSPTNTSSEWSVVKEPIPDSRVENSVQDSQTENAPEQFGTLETVANSPLVQKINSLGSGIQQGLARGFNTVAEALPKGAIPAIGGDLSTSVPEQIKTQVEDNPDTNQIGQAIGGVGAAAALTSATGGALAPALGTGLLNAVAANTIAGSVLAGVGNRIKGGIIGAAASGISPVISGLTNYIGKAATLGTNVKRAVNNITSQIDGPPDKIVVGSQSNMWNAAQATENQLFNKFRDVPGAVETNPVVIKAAEFLNTHSDELTPQQQKVIMGLIQNTVSSKSIADLHDARKIFAYDFGKFVDGKPLTAEANTAFRSLNDTVSSVMRNNADNLGVGKEFKSANDFYQNTVLPLMNTGAKDTAEALSKGNVDPLTLGQMTDTLINKYVKNQRPETAKVFLDSLDDTGRRAVEVKMVDNALKTATTKQGDIDYLAFKKAIQDTRTSTANIFSPETKKILNGLEATIDEGTHLYGTKLDLSNLGAGNKIGGLAAIIGATGFGAGPGAAAIVGGTLLGTAKLLNTRIGQDLLIRAGTKGGKEVAKQLLNGLLIQGILSQTNSEESNGN